jgi:predicted nuclease of predicted toxin-antitoxin system
MQLRIGQVLKIVSTVPITTRNIHIVFAITLAAIQQSIERGSIMRIVRITR